RPDYNSIVISQDKIIVVDFRIKIHQLRDGKFLDMLDSDSRPCAICPMDATTICVLYDNGLLETASIKSENVSPVFKKLKSLCLRGVFEQYHSVVKVNDNIVVVGVKQGTTYWCITSLDDGHVKIHQICKKSRWSSVTTKDNIIYISCYDAAYDGSETGVYAFDILNPNQCQYEYKHQRLQIPTSIVVDKDGNVFVGNYGYHDNFCIHQLTSSCQPVAIWTQAIPWYLQGMFWDNGRLYVTRFGSRDITVLSHVYQGSHKDSEVLASNDITLYGIVESAIQLSQES
ncbi:hypothetical protein ACJMK2_015281, partial [Sinanodonta woodiana]